MVCKNKKNIIILNLDEYKTKNTYQENSTPDHNYIIFSYTNKAEKNQLNHNVYKRNIFLRIFQILYFFLKIKNCHHIEIYTGNGSFFVIEYLLCKYIFRFKVLICERGSPLKDIDDYPLVARSLRRFVYRTASNIWIRELWMEQKLHSLKALKNKKIFFIHNHVPIVDEIITPCHLRQSEFIWCNTDKPWRRLDWFVEILGDPEFRDTQNVAYGAINKDKAVYKVASNTTLHGFEAAHSDFKNYKFFILAAEITFLNFSLLEAMSRGCIPIVSKQQGTELVIDDCVDGFIFDHDKDSLKKVMMKCLLLSNSEIEKISANARDKIRTRFSTEDGARKIRKMYEEIS